MSDATTRPPLAELYRSLIIDPPAGLDSPRRLVPESGVDRPWQPSFVLVDYVAVDPAALGLEGYESFHDIAEARLDAAIEAVVATEGPIHFEVLADRLLAGAGVGRLGRRIRERLVGRCEAQVSAGGLEGTGPFLGTPEQWRRPPCRDWRAAPDETRVLDHVCDRELEQALFNAATRGEREPEAIKNAGIHRIGFPRLTAAASERLTLPLSRLVAEGFLRDSEGVLAPTPQGLKR